MFENPFQEKIEQLKNGEITELVVEQKDFITFREIWKELPDKRDVVGEAGLNGKIVYRYVKNNN